MNSTVTATILAIELKTPDRLQMTMTLGDKAHQFIFPLERDSTDPEFVSFREDREFSRLFQYNAPIAGHVFRLLARVANGEKIQFPIEIGEFYPSEPAINRRVG